MAEPSILIEREGFIATVVIDRPAKLNAMTKPLWQSLGETIDALSADDTIRCIILRGAGEKAFSPGNDIAEFQTDRSNVEQARAYGAIMHRTLRSLGACRHPIVAMIHGICVGGGLEIAAMCDLRICGESSRFGVPIKNLGLVMAHAELDALVQLAGPAVALEILLEGRIFGAQEAFAQGTRHASRCRRSGHRGNACNGTPDRRWRAVGRTLAQAVRQARDEPRAAHARGTR